MRFYAGYLQERIGYDFYCDIAERIVEARERKGWRQADLAKRSGLSLSRIIAMEGVKTRITLPDIEALAKVLDVSADWLIDAQLDCKGKECLYLAWNERVASDKAKFYQEATSARMAFLRCEDKIRKCGVIWLEPRDRAVVRLVGVPVNDAELKAMFPFHGSQKEDPVDPDMGSGGRVEREAAVDAQTS